MVVFSFRNHDHLLLSIHSPRLIRPLCIVLFTVDGSYTADFVVVAGAFLQAAGVGVGGLLIKCGGIEWFLRITAVPFGGAENFIVIDTVPGDFLQVNFIFPLAVRADCS